jgi:diacylglycerol kinase family enzyme
VLTELFTKTIKSNRHVTHTQARRLHIHRPAEGAVHYDGDPTVMGTDIDIRLVPRGLKAVINPKSVEDKAQPGRIAKMLHI